MGRVVQETLQGLSQKIQSGISVANGISNLNYFDRKPGLSDKLVCPHCDELLTVPVDDPMGQDTFQCCECGGGFDVDWGEGVVRFEASTGLHRLRWYRC